MGAGESKGTEFKIHVDLPKVGSISLGRKTFTFYFDLASVSFTYDGTTGTKTLNKTYKLTEEWTFPKEQQEKMDKVGVGMSASQSFKYPFTDWKVVYEEQNFRIKARALLDGTATASIKKTWFGEKFYVEASLQFNVTIEFKREDKGGPFGNLGISLDLTLAALVLFADTFVLRLG